MCLYCDSCRRDLNTIGQDNMSYDPYGVLCEDCAGYDRGYDEAYERYVADMEAEYYAWLEQQYEKERQ